MLGLLFWRGIHYQDKPLVKHRVKQLRELLLERNWPVCWAQHCKACIKRMENLVGPIHLGWARAGAELWARKSIGTTSLLVGTFRHNNAIYHISFFLPDLSAGFMGRLFIKPSLMHHDLISYSLNITRCINYHCCTRATEVVKCFSFSWTESICLKCSQYH